MDLTCVVAMTADGVIGKRGELPWPTIHEDMRRFREITEGTTVVMGRKTFESLPGRKPLSNRVNIIISNEPANIAIPGVISMTLTKLLHLLDENDVSLNLGRIMVIGGGEIFRKLLSRCSRVYMTIVHEQYEGDTYFPINQLEHYRIVSEIRDEVCDFVELVRE